LFASGIPQCGIPRSDPRLRRGRSLKAPAFAVATAAQGEKVRCDAVTQLPAIPSADAIESTEELRPYLFAIAYRMLGSVTEAEDVVQDAFVRYYSADVEAASPKAYLATVTTRLAIDRLLGACSPGGVSGRMAAGATR
jgi:Sigma-70 region 2